MGPRRKPTTVDLDSALEALPGIGPARARALASAGVRRVADLLAHLPARYEDRRALHQIAEVSRPGPWTLCGRLTELRRLRVRRRGLTLVRGRLRDASGELPVVWFNRPYLPEQISPDHDYLVHGPARAVGTGWELLNPSCEPAALALHGGRIVPIYPALRELGPASLRRLLPAALSALAPGALDPDPLPEELRIRYGIPPWREALRFLHLPPAEANLELLNARRTPAHLRLIYGELLELQLELALLRAGEIREQKSHRYRIDSAVRESARSVLPFRLTGAQRRALREIVADLQSPHPMLRLLQGEVGSGKTIVAALALLVAAESGLQGAFMAPTELLAEQHYANLRRILGQRCRLALLTSSAQESAAARRALAAGEIQIVVGTHALIQEGVKFRRLGLVVIDEQHRFGVQQRRLLQRKGERPDLLVMTATPIPRSLALTAYGDLELTTLDELPPGRVPVATELRPASARRQVYADLRRELADGGQAYVVFPLIEESGEIAASSLAALGKSVRDSLGDYPSAVLHGRIPAPEREAIMSGFVGGRIRVLVATTVIEVGVDVPDASVMIIESAERFGLAQLHQLRGRVGRGVRPSRCVAVHGRLSDEARRRLEVFAAQNDGFQIAEADLRLRGPGDLLGTRQAGLPSLHFADLVADREWLERAREDARQLLPRLGEPELVLLRARVEPRAQSRYERFGGG